MTIATSNIELCLETLKRAIEDRLEMLLSPSPGPTEKLFESARYAVLGGGKRLRPLLALTTAKMFGVDPESILSPACTLELVHAYSLIHDDLPCMDNDDYRRGKLTVHRRYPEGHAVLTGDFLLTYAFDILASLPGLSSDIKIKLISTLARRIGSEGMIGGQVMDLASEGKTLSLHSLRSLHRNKTGALLTASIEFGGIIAEASAERLEALRLFGENIGLVFQIVDDILDVTASELKHGKQISSDILKEKSTYVSLLGPEEAKSYAVHFHLQAVNALNSLFCDTSELREIADIILHRTG